MTPELQFEIFKYLVAGVGALLGMYFTVRIGLRDARATSRAFEQFSQDFEKHQQALRLKFEVVEHRIDKMDLDLVQRSHDARDAVHAADLKIAVAQAELKGRVDRAERDIQGIETSVAEEFRRLDSKMDEFRREVNDKLDGLAGERRSRGDGR